MSDTDIAGTVPSHVRLADARARRDEARDAFCDALEQVGEDAPTLCDGWTAYDLAVHVWQLSNDPRVWIAVGLPPLAPLERRLLDETKRRRPFDEIVAALRAGSGAIGCMPTDRFEGYRHALGEYVVHTEDLRRPNGVSTPNPDRATRDALWRRTMTAARILRGRPRVMGGREQRGLVFERVEDGDLVARFRVAPGASPRIVRGSALELLLWTHGREAAARVEVR